ncbi:PP2C family protein-serine/threonine phosphatase [Streptomyces sp. NPDC090025]|uniref:PP2C family protein-serine/threonine phosphatase n=1 Tax=Streptomyces sp. NPDC090025 TaxID=3365922 RepID=UPI00383840B7
MSERSGERSLPEGEHEAVLARLDALEHAAAEIGSRLDEHVIATELAEFLVRRVADAAVVDLDPPDAPAPGPVPGQGPVPAPGPGPGVTVTAGKAGLLEETLPDGPVSGPASVAGDGRGEGEGPGDGPGGDGAGPVTPAPAAGERTGAASVLAAPLALPGGAELGRVRVARAAGAFSPHEAAVVAHAARLAAVHLRHAHHLAATEATALHLQRALVAEPGRPHPNLEIAGRYLPAGPRTLVGGDWFETVRLHFGRSLLVVGDVMGHGLDAAVDMNAYRSALREVAATDLPPHRVLRQLDAVVAGDDARRPATCLLIQVDPARATATFASAGHLPPVVFAADGSAELVDLPVGPPLGTGFGGYEPAVRTLAPADTLLLFTDGLVERRGEDIDVSLARLAALRLPPGSGPEAVVEEVLRRLDARHAEDDVALLAARCRERPTALTE